MNELKLFDINESPDNEEMIAEYLTAVLEDDNISAFLQLLNIATHTKEQPATAE